MPETLTLRHEIRPGDIGRIVTAHGALYAEEQGWNLDFEAYVAEGLGRFVQEFDASRDRLWLAERADGTLVGSIAIARHDDTTAQLRWFLVDPSARGGGLGSRLIDEALTFCRATGVTRVFLWTVAGLGAAARRYLNAGFELTETVTHERWGSTVAEQRYDLVLDARRER